MEHKKKLVAVIINYVHFWLNQAESIFLMLYVVDHRQTSGPTKSPQEQTKQQEEVNMLHKFDSLVVREVLDVWTRNKGGASF